MNAEIVAVGTELLLGQIVNTNAQVLSEALASVGVDVYRHTTVGDNQARMEAAIAEALARSDVVIVTGGLGPTPDDITREAVAAVTTRPLVRDAEIAERIEAVFARLGRAMPESNYRQADLPQGAVPVAPEGTAPGFLLEHYDRLIVVLPGVPWEMKAMLDKVVLSEIATRAGSGVLVTRHILVMGLGESATNEKIADIVAAQSNPTIAYLAGGGQVRVRLTAKAADRAAAEAAIAPVEAAIRERLGRDAVEGDYESMADAMAAMLRARGLSIAAAESLTGGLIGATLTRLPGASEFFAGALVCYSNDAKRNVAGLDPAILDGPGAVSEDAALALARAARESFKSDVAVAATGVAGPTESEGRPVGTVFVAAETDRSAQARAVRGYGDRDNIRRIAMNSALDLARRLLVDD